MAHFSLENYKGRDWPGAQRVIKKPGHPISEVNPAFCMEKKRAGETIPRIAPTCLHFSILSGSWLVRR